MKNLRSRDAHRYQVRNLCVLFGVTRQAYYKHDDDAMHQKLAQEEIVVQYVKEVRRKDPGLGGIKLWYMYRRAFGGSCPVGRDRFFQIVSDNDLKVRKRVRKPRTTDSTHGLPLFPNLVREYIPDAPNRLWVSDITYITLWLDEDTYVFCYLSMILDAYTEEIIGWSVGDTLATAYPLAALRMALKRIEGTDVCLIHHSDRGCQYASREYVSQLEKHGIRVSMTENGDPRENAQAERINNTVKNELLKDMVFHSIDEVVEALAPAIRFYNNERPHMSIDMMTPAQAASCTGEIGKRWKSYRLLAIKNKTEEANITENGVPLPASQGSPSGLRPTVNP